MDDRSRERDRERFIGAIIAVGIHTREGAAPSEERVRIDKF